MPADRGEEVVEVMRHASRQLAYRLHLLALNELGLQGLQLRSVMQNGDERRASGILHARKGDLKVHLHRRARGTDDLGTAGSPPGGGVGEPFRDRSSEPGHEFREVRRRASLDFEEVSREAV
jgi:hypothetical protein